MRGLILAVLLTTCKVHGAFGFKSDGSLDKDAISRGYWAGEFSRIQAPLEIFRRDHPRQTREDSIFVYKYLSVIYAADSATREKSENYMIRLVELMPTIELVDLYVSKEILAQFKNVKDQVLRERQYMREYDAYGRPLKKDSSSLSPKAKGSRKALWWTLAGAGAVAATGTAFLVLNEEPPNDKTEDVRP